MCCAKLTAMQRHNLLLLLLITFSACNSRKNSNNTEAADNLTIKNNSISKDSLLKRKFLEADTILLVNHMSIGYTDENANTSSSASKVFITGEPTGVLKSRQIISKSELDSLVTILVKPITEDPVRSMCIFDPRYSIMIIKNGISSYITVCFNCQQFETSPDLLSLLQFDQEKWMTLKSFFKAKGFNF